MLTELSSLVLNLPPLAYVAIVLVTVWYWMTRSSLPDNIPPFPVKPYPILGHIPMMKSGPVQKLHEWRLSTGDIFSIKLGPRLVVVMNSLDILKEALVKHADVFSNRYSSYLDKSQPYGLPGIVGSSGSNWKEQRSVSMSILRQFGMGKNFLAEKIMEEVKVYLNALSDFKGEPADVRMLTNASVSNIICAILLGQRFEFDDPHFVELLKNLNEQFALVTNSSFVMNFRWLKYVPGDFFNAKKIQKNVLEFRQFGYGFIQKTKETKDEDRGDSFIRAYLDEMAKRQKSEQFTHLDEENLKVVVANLFAAGSETTSTTILWAIVFAIIHPEAQEKVYQEIFDVVGIERLPSVQDKPNMNYTNAYIMETQRLGSIAPHSLTHLCIKTTEIAGYTVPAGTTIIPNLDEVLKDPKTWGDPLVFRPERFLDKENNLVVPQEFIPFSIGRRYCMGESLAKMELFLFITGIFQRFHVMPEDSDRLPNTDPVFGITRCPKPFKTKLIERTTCEQ